MDTISAYNGVDRRWVAMQGFLPASCPQGIWFRDVWALRAAIRMEVDGAYRLTNQLNPNLEPCWNVAPTQIVRGKKGCVYTTVGGSQMG